jgi:aldehyde:ferredoxin oxidoreductase
MTKETQEAIREEVGEKRAEVTMIGPGGENQVLFACVMNGLKDAAGRTGMGAVMGSKKLKAVAAFGTQPLEGSNPERLRELARTMARGVNSGEKAKGLHEYGTGMGIEGSVLTGNLPIRNFRDGEFPGAARLSADNFMAQIGVGMTGCYACAVRCKKMVSAEEPYPLDPDYGGPEYESFAALGSCCGVDDPVAVSRATELCNAYSLDTISCGVAIAFGMECFENGLLTLQDTGGINLRFGHGDALVKMVERIGRRQGLGNLLADGVKRAAAQIGRGAAQYAVEVKGQEYPMHEPRHKRGLAIGYAVSPTGADHCHSLHDAGMTSADENGFQPDDGLRSMGILEPVPLESLGPDKVRAFTYLTIKEVAGNCLCMCLFVPWSMAERLQILEAATGWDVSAYEYLKAGERALALARIFNIREGFGAKDDKLALRSYGPTTSGALAEGGIDAEELDKAVHAYYAMMGWDRETGVPTREKLWELDIAWAEQYLPKAR